MLTLRLHHDKIPASVSAIVATYVSGSRASRKIRIVCSTTRKQEHHHEISHRFVIRSADRRPSLRRIGFGRPSRQRTRLSTTAPAKRVTTAQATLRTTTQAALRAAAPTDSPRGAPPAALPIWLLPKPWALLANGTCNTAHGHLSRSFISIYL